MSFLHVAGGAVTAPQRAQATAEYAGRSEPNTGRVVPQNPEVGSVSVST